jgi:feruloyl esterase
MKIARLVLLPLLAGAAQQGFAAGSCEALKGLKLADARVTLAEDVIPNPEWKLPPSVFTGPAAAMLPGPRSTKAPFCRVALTIGKENNVEVWLPKDWNGTFQGVGNAGLTGGINYPAMAIAMKGGFATASTDTGHQTDNFFDTSWIAGHPERVVDFGNRAHHQMAVAAKQVVAKYYEKAARKSYYSGCSSGGWQGLTEAQKYPQDYDGIVAGAPANNFIKLQAHQIMEQRLSMQDGAGDLSAELRNLLVSAATAKCDAYDGVTDGVIGNPLKCDFDPASLQCTGSETKGCLTPAEVKRAKWSYGPSSTRKGLKLYPGFAYGAPPTTPLRGIDPRHPGDSAIALMLQQKPDWTVATFDPDKQIPVLEARFDSDLGATNPDLSAFEARGGKLIVYHGWADQLLSPYNSIDYYENVTKKLGPAQTDQFMRLFMAPGMAHCFGGPGPSELDAVDAMVKWVEHAQPPAQIVASHAAAGKVDRTRPLCPYPKVAKYKGAGNRDQAASFTCAAP